MSTIAELIESRSHTGANDSRQIILVYVVKGDDDDLDVKDLVNTTAPATYDDLIKRDIDIEPIHVDTASDDGIWRCAVTYITEEAADRRDAGDAIEEPIGPETDDRISFEIAGNLTTVLQSRQTIASFYNDANLPASYETMAKDFKGAINVNSDGDVEGAQIYTPVFSLQITRGYAFGDVGGAEQLFWMGKTATVNSAEFMGFAAGSVLYLGVSGGTRPPQGEEEDPVWVLTHTFAIVPNEVPAFIDEDDQWKPNNTTVKDGWDFVWAYYDRRPDDEDAEVLLTPPIYAYYERVYKRESFADLLAGGA